MSDLHQISQPCQKGTTRRASIASPTSMEWGMSTMAWMWRVNHVDELVQLTLEPILAITLSLQVELICNGCQSLISPNLVLPTFHSLFLSQLVGCCQTSAR